MATVDILSLLQGGHDEYIKSSDKNYVKLSTQGIAVTPRWWSQYGTKLARHTFNWTNVKFSDLEIFLKNNPTEGNGIGVYLFVAKPDFTIIDLPGYVFYVGIAGENDSGNFVRNRLKQYLQKTALSKRNKVRTALELYHPNTYVYFSKLNVTSAELSEIEEDLHGYFMPWANERDYPTPVKQARGAW